MDNLGSKRRLIFIHVAAMIFCIGFCALPQSSKASSKDTAPNIILIVADYMGYADIEPYGANDIKTPSLNQLAAEGVQFLNHYAAAPVCIPSRASLMSGMYPAKVLQRIGPGKGRGLPSEKNHLLNGLKSAGYKTALVGKWHLGAENNYSPNAHGFDYFFGFDDWTLSYYSHLTSDGEPGLYRNQKQVDESGYLTDLFTNEALAFIDQNSTSPFFLYLSYNAGLPPYQKPNLPKSQWDSGWDPSEASREDYAAMIERMDQGIGQVLSLLKEKSIEENTLVIFTYDHGGRHLVDSGPLFHGFSTLWEGGIRVPLIIRWPNKAIRVKQVNSPTIAMDVTATMLAAARPEAKTDSLDGENVFQILSDPAKFDDRELYWRFGRMKAIRKSHWKYVVDNHSQLLFNLALDVGERENLFNQRQDKVKLLKSRLSAWEESLDEE